jgi:uncharacterized protein (DUF779 family)
MTIEELQLTTGIWTPHAAVLCFHCHGAYRGGSPQCYEDHNIDTEKEIGYVDPWDAVCDKCGKTIWMDYKIAWEQRIAKALQQRGHEKAGMDQTGGMCSAAGLYLDGDEDGGQKHIMITECDDTVEDPNNPLFYIGFYHYFKHADGDYEEFKEKAVSFTEAIELCERIVKEGGPACLQE